MAILGSVSIGAGDINTPQNLYVGPASTNPTVNLRTLNYNAGTASVKVWITPTAVSPPDNVNSIDTTLLGAGYMSENTALPLAENNVLWVQSDVADVVFTAYGHGGS